MKSFMEGKCVVGNNAAAGRDDTIQTLDNPKYFTQNQGRNIKIKTALKNAEKILCDKLKSHVFSPDLKDPTASQVPGF